MASVIRNPQTETTTAEQKLEDMMVGAQAAVAAASAEPDVPKRNSEGPTWQDAAEEELLDVIQANNGKLVAGNDPRAKTTEEREKEVFRVSEEDSLEEALKKKAKAAEEQLKSQVVDDAELGQELEQTNGLNEVAQAIRDYGNYSVIHGKPELYVVMGGLSESLDMLVASTLPTENANGAAQDASNVIFLFQELSRKKKEANTELEREAELMLGGAVAILAIPEIIEKLVQLGIDPMIAESLKGPLSKLVHEASKKDSDLHSMYLVLREETELSKRDEEEQAA